MYRDRLIAFDKDTLPVFGKVAPEFRRGLCPSAAAITANWQGPECQQERRRSHRARYAFLHNEPPRNKLEPKVRRGLKPEFQITIRSAANGGGIVYGYNVSYPYSASKRCFRIN
jgi:hypothetical protein